MPTLAEVRDEHTPSYKRRRGGCAMISGRPVFNWSVVCSCGWQNNSNLSKREQESSWRYHTRSEWEKLRTKH